MFLSNAFYKYEELKHLIKEQYLIIITTRCKFPIVMRPFQPTHLMNENGK